MKQHSPNCPKSPNQFKIVIDAATEYTLHNCKWERYVIHGSQVIPEPVLRPLLESLKPTEA